MRIFLSARMDPAMAKNSNTRPRAKNQSPKVIDIQRLYDTAEAFFFAGILSHAEFDAGAVYTYLNPPGLNFPHADDAAIIALNGKKTHAVGAPRMVNFAFSIELYLKLLLFLANKELSNEHNLLKLFKRLVEVAPNAIDKIVEHYPRSENRDEFIVHISEVKSVFIDWRYVYEKDFLCGSTDKLLEIAEALRRTMQEVHPTLRSAYSPVT